MPSSQNLDSYDNLSNRQDTYGTLGNIPDDSNFKNSYSKNGNGGSKNSIFNGNDSGERYRNMETETVIIDEMSVYDSERGGGSVFEMP